MIRGARCGHHVALLLPSAALRNAPRGSLLWSECARNFSSGIDGDAPAAAAGVRSSEPTNKTVVYRGPLLRVFRILVRLKVTQLTAAGAAAAPLVAWNAGQPLTSLDVLGLTALCVGASAASGALWYYSRRYVGELSVLGPGGARVRISTLDFWGNRSDIDVQRSDIKAPFPGLAPEQLREAMAAIHIVPLEGACVMLGGQGHFSDCFFTPLAVIGQRQFIVFPRHGRVLNSPELLRLLVGESM